MKHARIIAIYFGPLPEWFPLWCASCRHNPDFDWLLIGDQLPDQSELPPNIQALPITLEQLRDLFSEKLGFSACIPAPYKICDFRPAFGDLFCEHLENYAFWGFCDLDVIFGCLSRFLPDKVLERHDRILTRGHLSLLRNTPDICGAYRWPSSAPDYRTVFTDPKNFIFDEWPGLHRILSEHNRPQFEEEVVADIEPNSRRLLLTRHTNYPTQAFIWSEGRIEQVYWDEALQSVGSKEFPYIHFQKRKLISRLGQCPPGGLAITARGFLSLNQRPESKNEIEILNKPAPWWQRDLPDDLSKCRIFFGRQRERLLSWRS